MSTPVPKAPDLLDDNLKQEIRMVERQLAPYADGQVPREQVERARQMLRRIIVERCGAYFLT